MITKTKNAVGYIRMSTDRQENSPERQRREINALAEREGYRITKWYEDHGLTGTESANRPEFQSLLRDAERGRFSAILLHEQSRFSREDIFDVMAHWRLLREAGVEIVTCQRGRLRFDDLGGIITAIIDQHGAREESIKLASRVVSGQRVRALQGRRIGGTVFGYDRQLYDDAGRPVQRVSFREKFRKPPTWHSIIVPSDEQEAVDAVRWAFEAIQTGQSMGYVIRGLNARGVTPHTSRAFTYNTVKGMLRNPTYAGILRVGKHCQAKFCRLDDEGEIIVEGAHEPIIDPDLFHAVQSILDRRHKKHRRAEAGKYLLSGVIRCSHCGNRMYGVHRTDKKKEKQLFYQCCNSPLELNNDPNCPHPAVREVVADVRHLHANKSNANALFQVASQFNLLEMVSPEVTPEHGVGIYEQDLTQGPACAIAAGGGTIYRNYFAPVSGRPGQSADNQIDCLARIGEMLGNTSQRLWQMVNGYAVPTSIGLAEVNQSLEAMGEAGRDSVRQALQIGLQWNTQVTLEGCSHLVSQAYCSAMPVSYSNYSQKLWEPFARLILEAAYEAVFCAAILNRERIGCGTLYLTLLGGGAFRNRPEWILDAIQRAVHLYADHGLDVAINRF